MNRQLNDANRKQEAAINSSLLKIRLSLGWIGEFADNHSHVVLLAPYVLLFTIFILLPVAIAMGLSFTYFNSVAAPAFSGMKNYITLLTQDPLFVQTVLPNTIYYALIVGVGGYILSFVVAWVLAQITPKMRTVLAIIIYSPSMTGGVIMATVWRVIFAGSESGYLNGLAINMGLISEPVAWLQNSAYIMPIMIIVSLWSSMGVGFLAMLAGVLNVDEELYDAGKIDGIRNRFQELIYVTIPSMRPQMLFGAVMAVVGTFQSSSIGVALTGSNPTPQYAGQLVVNHIEDYGFIRFDMGYASAISVILLIGIYYISRSAGKLFGDN